MEALLQIKDYDKFIEETPLQSANAKVIKDIVSDMVRNKDNWKGLNYLNSNDMNKWDRFLYKIIKFQPDIWEEKFSNVVNFIKILSGNWQKTLPILLNEMAEFDMGIDDFFKLERTVTFKMASLFGDVNILQKKLFLGTNIDISPFIVKISNAFLPPVVYQLEEYGLPRMISKKIDNEKVFDFTNNDRTLHETIKILKDIGYNNIIKEVSSLDEFDKYILRYFYDGI